MADERKFSDFEVAEDPDKVKLVGVNQATSDNAQVHAGYFAGKAWVEKRLENFVPGNGVSDVVKDGESIVDEFGVAILPEETDPRYNADKPQINARIEVLENRPSQPSNVDDVWVDGVSVVGEDKVARIELPAHGVEEAPTDGKMYGRRSRGWAEVMVEGGGILEESDPVAMEVLDALIPRVDALESKPAPEETDPVALPRIEAIEELIPAAASASNQLADKAFVNSTAVTMVANRVVMNAANDPFPTNAALMSATTFYYQGIEYTPTKNDYTNVSNDEACPDPKFLGGQTRYRYDGTAWVYELGINEKPFTAAEQAALASGITAQTVARMEAFMGGTFGGLVATNAPDGEIYVIAEGPVILATGVTITPSTFTIDESLSRQLVATVTPNNATSKAVNWSTSNAAIATVSAQGVVTAVAPGVATITATAADGSGVYGTTQVTVQEVQQGVTLVTDISLNYSTLSLDPSITQQLTATVSPSDATDPSVSWSSRNPEIATVSQTGLITAITAGDTVITCAANDASGVTAQCALTVRGAGQNEDRLIAHYDFGRYADGYQGVVEDLSGFNNPVELGGLSEYGEGMNGIINGRMQINRNLTSANPILSTMSWPIPSVLENPNAITVEMVARLRTRFSARDRLTSPTSNAVSVQPRILEVYNTSSNSIKLAITGAVSGTRGQIRVANNAGASVSSGEHDTQIMGYLASPVGERLPLSETMHHLAFVVSTTGMALYVNGVAQVTGGGRTVTFAGAKLAIFASTSDATRGDVAELKIYNTALTAQKVQSLYAAAKTKYPTLS